MDDLLGQSRSNNNPSPSANSEIGSVSLQGNLLGKLTVTELPLRKICGEKEHNITVALGNGLLTIDLKLSKDQHTQVKSLVDTFLTKSDKAHGFLLQLAILCTDASIESTISFKIDAEEINHLCNRSASSKRAYTSMVGVFAWCPIDIWKSLDTEDKRYLSPALTFKLSSLVESIPRDNLASQRLRTTLVQDADSSAVEETELLNCFIETIAAGRPIPTFRAAFKPLLEIACLPDYEHCSGNLMYRAISCLAKNESTLGEPEKLAIISAVLKTHGVGAVFYSEDSNRFGITEDLDKIRKLLGIAPEESLYSAFEIQLPANLADILLHQNINSCLEIWNTLAPLAEATLIETIVTNPRMLLTLAPTIALPNKLADALCESSALEELATDPAGAKFLAKRLSEFRSLPASIGSTLVERGFKREVADNLDAFSLSRSEISTLLIECINDGHLDSVVPRISSLSDKVLSAIDKATDNVLKDFKADCRILHPNIYSNYVKKYSDSGHKAAQAFVTQLWEMADRFIGYEGMTPAIKEHPLFEAVQSYVYPSNGARDYESLAHCLDRTEDLELFEIPSEAITVNLGDAPTISLRKGLSAEPSIASSVENLIRNTIRLAESPARLEATLQEQLARFGYDAEQQEPHMGIVDLLEQVAAGDLKSHQIKKLLITYHAWIHQDFKQYAADSVDRANQAQNRDYAYLLELQQFLTTDVVDSLTRAIRSTESQDKAHEATLISIATNVFTQEIESLKRELSKYIAQDSSGNQVRTIEAFFLKDRPSARMRDTAGLCVAEDNPSSVSDNSQRNIWDMENYFQLVLKDIESRRCIGGVLLHYYEEQNLRILTASINPSSTFLYKVDEDMLFKRIVGILADFAEANDIDVIGVSTEPEIRTNRTGGLFEQALNTQIRLVHERLSLKNPEPFSYTPDYKQQHLDVIWRRGDNLK